MTATGVKVGQFSRKKRLLSLTKQHAPITIRQSASSVTVTTLSAEELGVYKLTSNTTRPEHGSWQGNGKDAEQCQGPDEFEIKGRIFEREEVFSDRVGGALGALVVLMKVDAPDIVLAIKDSKAEQNQGCNGYAVD